MEDDLTNEMARQLPALKEFTEQATGMGDMGLPPHWLFACLSMLMIGRPLVRIIERIVDHFLSRPNRDRTGDRADP